MTDKTTDKTIAVLKYAESALLGRDRAVTELTRLQGELAKRTAERDDALERVAELKAHLRTALEDKR